MSAATSSAETPSTTADPESAATAPPDPGPDRASAGHSVGLREVNQRAGQIYREVEATGRPVTVTDRGRPIAQIVPIRREESWYERRVREGGVRLATRSFHVTPKRWTLPSGMTLEDLLAEDREEDV